MKIFGITGWKNSGKTSLIVKIVKELRARGYSVSTLKHAHHEFDIDKEGTDSYRHRKAGAAEVVIASSNRWALIHELLHEDEPDMDHLLTKMSPVDIVIVEGFKQMGHPKMQVVRPLENPARLPDAVENLVALAADSKVSALDYNCDGPVLNLNDVAGITDFITTYCKLSKPF